MPHILGANHRPCYNSRWYQSQGSLRGMAYRHSECQDMPCNTLVYKNKQLIVKKWASFFVQNSDTTQHMFKEIL